MAKTRKVKDSGREYGQKKSDYSYTAIDGSEWDSKFEFLVYQGVSHAVSDVRRCQKGDDTIPYTRIVPRASCQDCGSARVGEKRGITFDLLITDTDSEGKENQYYLESKGYMRSPKRSLYRSLFKERQDLSVRFVIQSNFKVGKGTFGGWISKHLRSPWALWKGSWETLEWNYPDEKRTARKAVRKVS